MLMLYLRFLYHIILFTSLIMVEIVFISSDYIMKTFLIGGVILFNSRICVCECPVGVNCPRGALVSVEFYMCFQ